MHVYIACFCCLSYVVDVTNPTSVKLNLATINKRLTKLVAMSWLFMTISDIWECYSSCEAEGDIQVKIKAPAGPPRSFHQLWFPDECRIPCEHILMSVSAPTTESGT